MGRLDAAESLIAELTRGDLVEQVTGRGFTARAVRLDVAN